MVLKRIDDIITYLDVIDNLINFFPRSLSWFFLQDPHEVLFRLVTDYIVPTFLKEKQRMQVKFITIKGCSVLTGESRCDGFRLVR